MQGAIQVLGFFTRSFVKFSQKLSENFGNPWLDNRLSEPMYCSLHDAALNKKATSFQTDKIHVHQNAQIFMLRLGK